MTLLDIRVPSRGIDLKKEFVVRHLRSHGPTSPTDLGRAWGNGTDYSVMSKSLEHLMEQGVIESSHPSPGRTLYKLKKGR